MARLTSYIDRLEDVARRAARASKAVDASILGVSEPGILTVGELTRILIDIGNRARIALGEVYSEEAA